MGYFSGHITGIFDLYVNEKKSLLTWNTNEFLDKLVRVVRINDNDITKHTLFTCKWFDIKSTS